MSRWQSADDLIKSDIPHVAAAEDRLNRWAKAWAASTFGIDAPPVHVGPTGHKARGVRGYFDLGALVASGDKLTAPNGRIMVNEGLARGFVELPAGARPGLDRYLRDVVKHELIHAALTRDAVARRLDHTPGENHDGPFAELANQIGRREGLDPVHAGSSDCHKHGRDRDRMHWLTCACAWPHYSGGFEARYGDAFAWVHLTPLL